MLTTLCYSLLYVLLQFQRLNWMTTCNSLIIELINGSCLSMLNPTNKQWKLFSKKNKCPVHHPIFFNGIEVTRVDEHKHLGLTVDPKLTFEMHIISKSKVARKNIGILKYIYPYLPLITLDQLLYWQGTSRNGLYEELGMESLSDRRWSRHLLQFYKIYNIMTPTSTYTALWKYKT